MSKEQKKVAFSMNIGQEVTASMHNRLFDPFTKRRVMISSSHNDTRFMMRVLLEMWGYEVIEADGVEDSTHLAETRLPHVVLVDTSRQFENDLKVVSAVRKSKMPSSVPVIVLSAFAQQQFQMAAFEHGATGVLSKPLDLDLLKGYLGSSVQ